MTDASDLWIRNALSTLALYAGNLYMSYGNSCVLCEIVLSVVNRKSMLFLVALVWVVS